MTLFPASYPLPASCRLPPASCPLPPASWRLPPASCPLLPAVCLLSPASCLLPSAACRLPPASCRLPPFACLLPSAFRFVSFVRDTIHSRTVHPSFDNRSACSAPNRGERQPRSISPPL